MKEDLIKLSHFTWGAYKATGNEAFKYIYDWLESFSKEPDRIKDELLSQPIETLELTKRTYNALMSEEIYIIHALVNMTEKDFFKLPNLGKKSFNEIKDVLKTHGLRIKGD